VAKRGEEKEGKKKRN